MEPLKITSIGQYENEVLTIYKSIINRDVCSVLLNFDQDIDADAIPFTLDVWIGEGPAARMINYQCKFPFIKKISEADEVQNVLQTIQKFSTIGELEQIQNDGLLWFFKGNLIWVNRPVRNNHDYDLVCLRIEEHVYSEHDEILRL